MLEDTLEPWQLIRKSQKQLNIVLILRPSHEQDQDRDITDEEEHK